MSVVGRLLAALAVTATTLAVTSTDAGERGLRAPLVETPPELDGVPAEWDAEWRDLSTVLEGARSTSDDLAARAALGHDAERLYVAVEVTDDRFVPGADQVELLVGFPGGALESLRLLPGEAGNTRATARTASGKALEGARVVEAPTATGWSLEASIPWRALPGGERVRVGLRGALRVHDADASSAVESVLATSSARGYAGLPPLSTEPELALGAGLLRERGLTMAPRVNLVGDVAGDALLERVLVYDRFLIVLGPGYRGGREYFFRELRSASIAHAELGDLTGDGKDELVLVLGDPGSERLEILGYPGSAEVPAQALDEPLAPGERVHVAGRGVGARVLVEGHGASRTFAMRDGVLSPIAATGRPHAPAGSETTPTRPSARASEATPPRAAIPDAARTPEPASGRRGVMRVDEPPADPDAVLALYRARRGVDGPPRFDIAADFAEDARLERLVVHGSDLVLFGPGFAGGRSFSATTLGDEGRDLVSARAVDVTGDGKAELVLTARLEVALPPDLGEGRAVRTLAMVFQVQSGRLERVFAAEIARSVGERRVEARLELGMGSITLAPGSAVGFDERTYPWKPRSTPEGGFEPLVLPWSPGPVRLVFEGARFVRR